MRYTLIFLAMTLLAAPAIAQAQAPTIGLKGGMNLSNFGGARVIKSDYNTGMNVGAYISIPVAGTLSIQPELLLSRKGGNRTAYDDSDMPVDGFVAPPIRTYINGRATSDYLEIPLLFKLDAADPGDRVRPVLFAGPSVGFLLSTKSDWHGYQLEEEYQDHLNSTELGLVIGGGVEVAGLSIDARYNLALSSFAKDYDSSIGLIQGDVKNRAFTLLLGYRIF